MLLYYCTFGTNKDNNNKSKCPKNGHKISEISNMDGEVYGGKR